MAKMVNTYLWNKAEGGVPTQDFEALKNRVDSLANVAAKTNITNTFTTNQQINGQLKLAKAAEALIIDSSGDKFIAFKNGNTRESYIGRASASSRDLEINSGTGNLKLTTGNNQKITTNADYEGVNRNIKILSLTLGFGGTPVIAPDEGTTKPLRFSNGNIRFGSLDLQNQTKLANVPNIKTLTVSNIANNASKQQNLPGNSIVLMVRRNSNGANHNNWKLLNNGTFTITNDVGSTENFIVTYWEV